MIYAFIYLFFLLLTTAFFYRTVKSLSKRQVLPIDNLAKTRGESETHYIDLPSVRVESEEQYVSYLKSYKESLTQQVVIVNKDQRKTKRTEKGSKKVPSGGYRTVYHFTGVNQTNSFFNAIRADSVKVEIAGENNKIAVKKVDVSTLILNTTSAKRFADHNSFKFVQ